jgi:hypothetical protein
MRQLHPPYEKTKKPKLMRHTWKKCVLGSLLLALVAGNSAALAAGLHEPLDALLRAHVKKGVVDYRALKGKERELDAYIDVLDRTDPSTLSGDKDRLAFWINAYNAFTLKLILERYPGIRSFKEIPQRWSQKHWSVGGQPRSLEEIEHSILRKELHDPRVHFALVCASRSCPDIRSEAYDPIRLDTQFDEQTRSFLKDATKGFLARSESGVFFGVNHRVYLSSILKWFSEDFGSDGKNTIDFVLLYIGDEGREFVNLHRRELPVRFLDYDWSLNGS